MVNFFGQFPGVPSAEQFIGLFVGNMGFRNVGDLIKTIVDVAIVAYIVYRVILLVKETRAWQLAKGIMIIIVVAKLSDYMGFKTTAFLLKQGAQYIAIAVVVLFQPELRRMLEEIGRGKFKSFFNFEEENNFVKVTAMIEEIIRAVSALQTTGTGAIIVLERDTKIGEIIDSGTKLDSNVVYELIVNIFKPGTPLHDGAVVIRDGKIKAAGCFLPLTDNHELSKGLGTRHRAALGVSEASDAIAIVVSEETGTISVAMAGGLIRNLTPDTLRQLLHRNILPRKQAGFNKRLALWKVKGK